MRTASALLALLLALPIADAEEADVTLEDVVVTPGRRPAPRFEVPFSTETLPPSDLSGGRAPRSITNALEALPGVMVQRTGYGQGSPYIRGLTGFRTLLLVDGVRLNDSVFRDGPNQYVSTVDQLSLAGVELVRGPASVLYGSDSIGGTLNFIPLSPPAGENGTPFGGRVLQRFASVERSSITRLEVTGGVGPDFGFLAGVDRKLFDDLRAGDGRLDGTGYGEWDGDARFVWSATPDLTLVLGYQRAAQDDVPRTHKTVDARSWHGTDVGSELVRVLDQNRDLLYVRGRLRDDVEATFSWQGQREKRYRRRTGGRIDRQGVDVSTLGLAVRAGAGSDVGALTFGFDAYRDQVDSFSAKYDASGRKTSEGIQGPVGDDAVYDLLGLWIMDEVDVRENLTLTAAVRGTYARADADAVEDPQTGREISVEDDWRALTGSLRLGYGGIEDVYLYGGVSQGFRAPNLSDLTRLDTARSNEIETPSPGLDPEHALSFEIGARAVRGPVRGEVSVFHTVLRDLIVRFPTGRVIGGDNEVTKDNVGDGYVQGVEVSAEADAGAGFTVFGGGSFMIGKLDTYPTLARKKAREYIDRLPPLSGRVGGTFDGPAGVRATAVLRMADKADRLSTRDRSDTQRIPPGGTPGYGVLDLSATWEATEAVTLTLGVENVLDKAYRIHGSGQNEPGRNVWLVLVVEF